MKFVSISLSSCVSGISELFRLFLDVTAIIGFSLRCFILVVLFMKLLQRHNCGLVGEAQTVRRPYAAIGGYAYYGTKLSFQRHGSIDR